MALSIGQIFQNRWKVIDTLGEGGTAIVYLVKDNRLGKLWALKEVKIDDTPTGQAHIKATLDETNLLKKLNYSTIPRIVEVFKTTNHLYILMDYIDGKSLRDVIREKAEKNERISDELIIKWTKTVCKTFRYLHNHEPKIIYRDMKPHNLMLDSSGDVKVLDFGAAFEYTDDVDIQRLPRLGTRGYRSPEQYAKKVSYTEQSDIFTLGRTMYHIATNISPSNFGGTIEKVKGHYVIRPEKPLPKILDVVPEFNKPLAMIIEKAMAPNPQDRYQSADEMLFALENINKMSSEYKKKMRGRLFAVITSISGLVLGLSMTAGGYALNHHNSNSTYANLIKSGTATRSLQDFVEASKIKVELDSLTGAVDVIAEDGIFSQVEEEQFLTLIDGKLDQYSQLDGFDDVAYRLGRLYWYNYTNGEVKAKQWFDFVADSDNENKNQAMVLSSVASFKQVVQDAQKDNSDSGLYREQWDLLFQLEPLVVDDTNLTLTLAEQTLDLLEGYSAGLKADGILRHDLTKTLDKRIEMLEHIQDLNDNQSEQLDSILSRKEKARVMVDTTFGKRDTTKGDE